MMLQLLDDGRITDSQGHVVDCKHAIVLLTSNLGAEHMLRVAGCNASETEIEQAKERTLGVIRRTLRPELLNRLDDVVVFNPLSGQVLRQVVKLQLKDVVRRLEELDITLNMTDESVDFVLKEAHDPELGARPIKRFLERHIVSRLSRLILSGELPEGSAVTVGVKNQDWDFRVTTRDDTSREASATLGRAGSRDGCFERTSRDSPLHRSDSASKRQRI
mmetsp:Transcript_99058/g.256103  ORF Transcript_99058/g.256103 Transcript_99058/m.256103 type:complete len:219 (-) Transcript_99058:162-818(-)